MDASSSEMFIDPIEDENRASDAASLSSRTIFDLPARGLELEDVEFFLSLAFLSLMLVSIPLGLGQSFFQCLPSHPAPRA